MAAYDSDDDRPLSDWRGRDISKLAATTNERDVKLAEQHIAVDDSGPRIPRNTYYTANSPDHALKRPLIDQVTNSWQHEKGSGSGFGGPNDDFEDEPSWPSVLRDLCKSRRFRRMLVVVILILVACYYGWSWYLQPRLQEERVFKEGFLHDRLKGTYGISQAGDFEGTRIKELDTSLLPGGEKDPDGKRRLVFVGDIHGCRKELMALLDKVGFDGARDHLIATGDVTSKGPDSLGVLDELMHLNAESVRGNHEDRSLESAKSVLQSNMPSTDRTYTSKGQAKDAALLKSMKPRHIQYLRNMPLMLRVPALPQALSASKRKDEPSINHEIIVVHAGLVPNIPLDKQDPYFVMNMRSIDHRTHVPSSLRAGSTKSKSKPWYEIWNWYNDRLDRGRSLRGFFRLPQPSEQDLDEAEGWFDMLLGGRKTKLKPQIVVYGHDSKSDLQIHPWSKGLDSGCVAGGKLTAMVLSADGRTELVSVKCKNYKA